MSNEELKPCLHCSGSDIKLHRFTVSYAMMCNGCCAMGPSEDTYAEAIAAWNKRYVCPDKNDNAVYAGDEVKHEFSEEQHFEGVVVWHKVGYCIKRPHLGLWRFEPSQIELIESEEPNGS